MVVCGRTDSLVPPCWLGPHHYLAVSKPLLARGSRPHHYSPWQPTTPPFTMAADHTTIHHGSRPHHCSLSRLTIHRGSRPHPILKARFLLPCMKPRAVVGQQSAFFLKKRSTVRSWNDRCLFSGVMNDCHGNPPA